MLQRLEWEGGKFCGREGNKAKVVGGTKGDKNKKYVPKVHCAHVWLYYIVIFRYSTFVVMTFPFRYMNCVDNVIGNGNINCNNKLEVIITTYSQYFSQNCVPFTKSSIVQFQGCLDQNGCTLVTERYRVSDNSPRIPVEWTQDTIYRMTEHCDYPDLDVRSTCQERLITC